MKVASLSDRNKSKPRKPEQVWLPGLQVWAAVGSQAGATSVASAATPLVKSDPCIVSKDAVMQAVQPSQAFRPAILQAEELLPAEANVPLNNSLPTCPICQCLFLLALAPCSQLDA